MEPDAATNRERDLITSIEETAPFVRLRPLGDSLDQMTEERYGPRGTPAREAFEAYGDRLARRNEIVHRLTHWLARIPPRWQYAEPEVIEGDIYRFYHGVGHIAECFWADVLDQLLAGRNDRSIGRWLASVGYLTLDGLAFHYFDDAYVPWPREVGTGKVRNWRWRRRQAMRTSNDRTMEDQDMT